MKEVRVETRQAGSWIGDDVLERFLQDGWVLHAVIQARDFAKNEPEHGTMKFVFYRGE